jgi:hypothetical protein
MSSNKNIYPFVFGVENPEPYVWKEPEPFVYVPPFTHSMEESKQFMESLKMENSRPVIFGSTQRMVKKKNTREKQTILNLEFYHKISAGLSEIPNMFGCNLRTLDLSYNNITSVSLPYNCNIIHLILNNNKIDRIHCLPKNIHILEMSNNEIRDASIGIIWDRYPSLMKIVMNNNHMQTLQGSMPPSLVHLECSHNKLTHIDIISSSLKNLILKRNNIQRFALKTEELTVLDLKGNNHLDFIPNLSLMKKLKYLDLSSTGYHQLDDNEETEFIEIRPFDNLPSTIEELILDDLTIDRLSFLPMNIRRLSCNDCGLEEIEGLAELENLKHLNCCYNHLQSLTIPESLENLYCQNNDLTSLNIPYRNRLKHVDCSNNRLKWIEHVPVAIKEIRHFICHKNPLFFLNPASSRHPLSIPVLRLVSLARNVSYVVLRVVNNPELFRHLIRSWGSVHDSIKKGIKMAIEKCQTDECPICYCSIDSSNRCINKCLHGFCSSCCRSLSKATCCPMCRNTIEWAYHSGPKPEPIFMMDAFHERFSIFEAFDRYPLHQSL